MKRWKAYLTQHYKGGTALTRVAAIWRVGRGIWAPPDEAPRYALPPWRVPYPLHCILRRECHCNAQEQDLHVSGPGGCPFWRDGRCYGHLWDGLMARGWVPLLPMPVRTDARQIGLLINTLCFAVLLL